MPFTDNFLQGFTVGRTAKDRREQLENEAEDRKLYRMRLKHEIDRTKIKDIEDARKGAFEEAQLRNSLMEPADVQIPEGAYGQPPETMHVSGLRATLAEQMKAQAQARLRQVTPETSAGVGLPPGGYDPEIINQVGQTTRERETRKAMATEGAANRANALQVARINATGKGTGEAGDQEFVKTWARKLNTGQANLSQLTAGKNGQHRDAVLNYMESKGMGIMTPKVFDKLSQFNTAKASIEKIRGTFDRIQKATSASERLGATMQLNAEVSALSRNVGRSQGERGVFTNDDKKDFVKIIQPGGGGVMTGVLANLTPELGAGRLDQLEALMEGIRNREFRGFEELTGQGLAVGRKKKQRYNPDNDQIEDVEE